MNNTHTKSLFSLLMCLMFCFNIHAQDDCVPIPGVVIIKGGEVSFNYGSTTNAVNSKRASSIILGEPVVGQSNDTKYTTEYGFYSQFLLPPQAPVVTASQGELLDRIQITWAINPLGGSSTGGFNIYRDGIFLDNVGPKIRSYNDFNVIAGRPYTYTIAGINDFGEGYLGSGLGFMVPNGVVTGQLETPNGNPVVNATVSLDPMQGFSTTYGIQHGAGALANVSKPFLPNASSDWTISYWVKTNSSLANGSILQVGPHSEQSIRFLGVESASGNEGIVFKYDGNVLSGLFASANKNDWHHVTLTHRANGLLTSLYIDGVLAEQKPINIPTITGDLNIGNRFLSGGWAGKMDELRFYHGALDEVEIEEAMLSTASSDTPDLAYYWKMDEELGNKCFDNINRYAIYLCGGVFDIDRPAVHTAGKTNIDGFYRIEGVSYGTGTTFLATPSKNFYTKRSLQFNSESNDWVALPSFTLPEKTTLEMWFNASNIPNTQTLLSKKIGMEEFSITLIPDGNDKKLQVNMGSSTLLTPSFNFGYKHLVVKIDNGNATVYLNNNQVASGVLNVPTAIDSTHQWILAEANEGTANFFDGYIDEIAVYDTLLSAAQIQAHYTNSRSVTEPHLMVYFPMDEGSGFKVNNMGSLQLNPGNLNGPNWSIIAPHQQSTPHEFTPRTRQVTLNPSVTSVDRVDFTDRSTIPVTGYVRYKNTDCFQEQVEILVNGESFTPPVFTDSVGKFVIDFDPGMNAILTPVFKDHTYSPAFWEISNLTNPIAGILFSNTLTHDISGIVAGGKCEFSIIDANTVCIVKASSADGCFTKFIEIDNEEGQFHFENLPPLPNMVVAVIEHSDPDVKASFQAQGGYTFDITEKDTIAKFIYHSEPSIRVVDGFESYSVNCPQIVMEKDEIRTLRLKLVEPYYNGAECELDTALFRIINTVADTIVDLEMSNKLLTYRFKVGSPNPSAPHTKNIQIVASTIEGNDTDLSVSVIVTGKRAKDQTFTTTLPEKPTMVVRDPPGDGSYAYVEKGQTSCRNYEVTIETDETGGNSTTFDAVPNVSLGFNIGDIFSIGFEVGGTGGQDKTFLKTVTKTKTNGFEVCLTNTERISTSDNDLVVGAQGGDVFVGGGLNIEFGFVDNVSFDTTQCIGVGTQSIEVVPGDFATTFYYSEWNIKNNVLYSLDALLNAELAKGAMKDTSLVSKYNKSISSWQKILSDNEKQKKDAKFIRNISFDGGSVYEYSESSDSISVNEAEEAENEYSETDSGGSFYAAGIGGGKINIKSKSSTKSEINGGDKGESIETGFTLADDDILDAFSVDIKMDPVYKTPVITTKAGQSSCPWEPGTAKREGVFLESVDGPVRTDVPADQPAVFHFLMHNTSATNETWTYAFTAGPESNPHSAKIFCNGAPMNIPQFYAIPWGTNIPVTVVLERGPVEYDYDDLEIVLYSLCEDSRANDLGILPDTAENLYSAVYISAHFLRPCSEVKINVPEQNFVVFPDPLTAGSDDIRRITVSGYDTTSTDFQLVRLQYRKTNGDGAWINILPQSGTSFEAYNGNWSGFGDLPNPKPPKLQPKFTQFFWNTDGLADGEYEIRAVTVCTGDAGNRPGSSEIIRGRIDREPPKLLGVPQPSDGVYHVGDEVSFTFNQPINCNKLIQADIFNANNVGLYDATTDQLIDTDISCHDNKIVINPNFENKFFENRILRAELHNIEDLVGNKNVEEEWEFYVDRNELAWLEDSLEVTKFVDETQTTTAKIHNRGGYPVPFTITAPPYIHVTPDRGTLVANEVEDIHFTIDQNVAIGNYSDSIIMHTETGLNPFFMGGDEVLNMHTRVICRPPAWVLNPSGFDPSDFSFSMNMVVELDIEGELSEDKQDIVGAYVNGVLRGIAKVEYNPSFNNYVAYLTVYSNLATGESIEFQVWDASECRLFAKTVEVFPFIADDLIGNAMDPQTLHTNGKILRRIYIHPGWNWISMNLELPDNSLNGALESLSDPAGALIKEQTTFAAYSSNTQSWLGSLVRILPQSLYQYNSQSYDSILMVGEPLDVTMAMPLNAGWNWIGFLPQTPIPIDVALASLQPTQGDVIKGQLSFAQYFNGVGWVGNLRFLDAPNGYLIKLANADTLSYPNIGNVIGTTGSRRYGPITEDAAKTSIDETRSTNYWQVDAAKYEHTMNVIAIISPQGSEDNLLNDGDEVAAFVGGEVRGSSKAMYIPALKSYMIFMTIYANKEGEVIKFKYHNASQNKTYDLAETTGFVINNLWGNADAPQPLHIMDITATNEVSDATQSLTMYPNPFANILYINYVSKVGGEAELTITDAIGSKVERRNVVVKQGMNVLEWKPKSNLSGGTYFVAIKNGEEVITQKVLYIK